MIFSPCGRYIYGVAPEVSRVMQFDTWRREMVKVIEDPFRLGDVTCGTLSFWHEEVMLVGLFGSHVVALHLPFERRTVATERGKDPEDKNRKYSRSILAMGPRHITSTKYIHVIWPDDGVNGEISVISQPPNFFDKIID